jgi:hypothetical protein
MKDTPILVLLYGNDLQSITARRNYVDQGKDKNTNTSTEETGLEKLILYY